MLFLNVLIDMIVQNRGWIIEKTIRQMGFTAMDLSQMTNTNRRTIYRWFQTPNLKLDIIIQIGRCINYDFSTIIAGIPKQMPVVKPCPLEDDLMDELKQMLFLAPVIESDLDEAGCLHYK